MFECKGDILLLGSGCGSCPRCREALDRVSQPWLLPMRESDDRPSLPAFGWAPGFYMGKCDDCGYAFMGDKRASRCAICAYNARDEVERKRQTDALIAAMCGC